jgi:hypothetical protein
VRDRQVEQIFLENFVSADWEFRPLELLKKCFDDVTDLLYDVIPPNSRVLLSLPPQNAPSGLRMPSQTTGGQWRAQHSHDRQDMLPTHRIDL